MTATRRQTQGPQSINVSYLGNPQANVFYTATDLAGNILTARTNTGVIEDPLVPGLYFYDQVVSIDQFITFWDEDDGADPAQEVVSTRHIFGLPLPPTSVVAVAGDTTASISFTAPSDNGGSAVLSYTVTASGGQTVTAAYTTGVTLVGLTNGVSYTFTVHATTTAGDSAESAASNAIVPAVAATAPSAPVNVVANQTASGEVTVTFDPPVSNGGSAITSYRVSAVDEDNPAHNTTQTGNSPSVLTGLFADTYHFTARATNAIGNSPESTPSSPVDVVNGPVTSVATFAHYFSTSTKLTVDATSSVGTLTWEIDGVEQPDTDAIISYGPLTVGTHHVKLTAEDMSGSSVSERDIDVPFIGEPLGMAQGDIVNGGTGGASGTGLPLFAVLPPIGPFATEEILNETEGYPGVGDNIPRLESNVDGSITLTRLGTDYTYAIPVATQPRGQKYRPAFRYGLILNGQKDNTANGRAANAYRAVSDINAAGNLALASDSKLRFFRYEFLLVGTNPDLSHPPGYSSTPPRVLYMNNVAEAGYGGNLFLIFVGQSMNVTITDILANKAKLFDSRSVQYDVWHNYVLEIMMSPDPTIGYGRVYRDGVVVTNVPAGTDSEGRHFQSTVKLDGTGKPLKLDASVTMYPTWEAIKTEYDASRTVTDFSVKFRNFRVGPTLDSVLSPPLIPLPTVTSASPSSRARGQSNQTISITGTDFYDWLPGVTVAISGPGLYGDATGITINSTTLISTTQIDLNIDVASSAPTGLRWVTVTNPTGGVATGSIFTVT